MSFTNYRRFGKRKNSGVSEIIATLLMILVVVAIGTTLFAYATGSLTSFGSNFSILTGTAGDQITEDIVVEQVIFVNTGSAATSGADLYIRDVGINPSTISAIYVQNLSSSNLVEQFTSSPLPATINSGPFQIIFVSNFLPDHGVVYQFTLATSLGNKVIGSAKYY